VKNIIFFYGAVGMVEVKDAMRVTELLLTSEIT
jgi:hypothetical protein